MYKKKYLNSMLFFSLLTLVVCSSIRAILDGNLSKKSLKDSLEKLKNCKTLFKVGTFVLGVTTSLKTGFVIQERVVEAVYDHYFSFKKINFFKRKNQLKIAAGGIAGQMVSFVSTYCLSELSAKYNATRSPYSSFLSGLELGSKAYSYETIANLIQIWSPQSGFHRVGCFLLKKNPKFRLQWYHIIFNDLAKMVTVELLRPDFIKMIRKPHGL